MWRRHQIAALALFVLLAAIVNVSPPVGRPVEVSLQELDNYKQNENEEAAHLDFDELFPGNAMDTKDNDNNHNHTVFAPLHCANQANLLFHPITNVTLTNNNTTIAIGYYPRWGQSSVGNVLSGYFGYLAYAVLGGYNFAAPHEYDHDVAGFVTLFPQYYNRSRNQPPNATTFERLCNSCGGVSMSLIHACDYGWSDIVDIVSVVVQAALSRYLSHDLPSFAPNDWLIYDRMLLPSLPEGYFGVATISVYSQLPKNDNQPYTVYILESPREEGHKALYRELLRERDQYIRTHYPHVQLKKLEPFPSFTQDFARLVFCSNLLLVSAGSSFSLWGAVSSRANVVTVPIRRHMDMSVYPPHVRVLKNQRVLYHPDSDPVTAALYNLSYAVGDEWFDTEAGREAVRKAYLEEI